jgi:ERCC4-related helicase
VSSATDEKLLPLLAPGSQVLVRDEEWVVRARGATETMGLKISVVGTSELVRDQEATFFTALDKVRPLDPNDTKLVADDTPNFRSSRLYLEALLRKTPVPISESRLTVGPLQLLDSMEYQRQPVAKALEALQPRILIADAVGLGKTLEVGMLLSELIRRGRGERILVVTPKHILEQFQLEMWSRFSIPLVRLDSEGIQRVRQRIPATRNPFTFFKRVIISIDTLKDSGRYRHHLEQVQWDAVVIDECHNLVNRSSLRNQLARTLAPNTDALILTSATPHNGKPESFAELINLLDPTAIADPKDYTSDDIKHLYVRRHKNSPSVEHEVGAGWANRRALEGVRVTAGPAEEAVLQELHDVWMHPSAGGSPVSGEAQRLFPYTLLKAFLSSHEALAETIKNRMASIGRSTKVDPKHAVELAALEQLGELNAKVDDMNSSKLRALSEQLAKIGVGPKSDTRVVIFSERHATLEWLARALPTVTKLKPNQVRVLHGGLPDTTQMEIVEEFALEKKDVRVLLTGDIASEGVNLHRQCHHLIHFDLPWSLITIEQRNGRIDRYGQKTSAEIRALILESRVLDSGGEMAVLLRLLDKAEQAYKAYGDTSPLMGLYDEKEEEKEVIRAMAGSVTPEAAIPDAPLGAFDLLMATAGAVDTPTAVVKLPSLFASDAEYFGEALRTIFDDPERELELRIDATASLVSFRPPPDLARRLDVLPQNYLKARKVLERLKLTSDADYANASLKRARDGNELLWPEEVFFTGQHPVMEWISDKLLQQVGRNEAPVLVADVDDITFIVQGLYSNKNGQATVVEWMAVDRVHSVPRFRSLADLIASANIGPRMPNPGGMDRFQEVLRAQSLVRQAVQAGRDHLKSVRQERSHALLSSVKAHQRRLDTWKAQANALAEQLSLPGVQEKRKRQIDHAAEAKIKLIERLASDGDPLVRVVAVLVP